MNEHDAETMLGGDFPPFAGPYRTQNFCLDGHLQPGACKTGSESYACSSRKVSLPVYGPD